MVHKNFLALLDYWNRLVGTIHGSGHRPAGGSIRPDGLLAWGRLHGGGGLHPAEAFPSWVRHHLGTVTEDLVVPRRSIRADAPPGPCRRRPHRVRSTGGHSSEVASGAGVPRRTSAPTEHERERTRREEKGRRKVNGCSPIVPVVRSSWCEPGAAVAEVGARWLGTIRTLAAKHAGEYSSVVAGTLRERLRKSSCRAPLLQPMGRVSTVGIRPCRGIPTVCVQPSLVSAGRAPAGGNGPGRPERKLPSP